MEASCQSTAFKNLLLTFHMLVQKQESANVFYKVPGGTYFRPGILWKHLEFLQDSLSQSFSPFVAVQKQYMNKRTRLCCNKTLFKTPGCGPGLTCLPVGFRQGRVQFSQAPFITNSKICDGRQAMGRLCSVSQYVLVSFLFLKISWASFEAKSTIVRSSYYWRKARYGIAQTRPSGWTAACTHLSSVANRCLSPAHGLGLGLGRG